MKPFPQRWAASDSGSEDETRARAPGNDFLGDIPSGSPILESEVLGFLLIGRERYLLGGYRPREPH